MVERLHFLRKLGVPGSAVTVLSQLSEGDKTTSEMSKTSGMSKSAILVGVNYWHKLGVAKRSNTNEWQINELNRVKEMVEILKVEENELISSIARIDELID
mgnify:FL=1|jgi:hypothetical protein